MITLALDDESRQTIQQFLARLDGLNNMQESDIESIRASIRFAFLENFGNEKAGDGDPWDWLKPRTQRQRELQGYNPTRPILRRTGSYMRSFAAPDAEDHISIYSSANGINIIEEGSTDYRAFALEFGRPEQPMEPRPVTIPSSAGESRIYAAIEQTFEHWFEEAT